MNLDFWKKIAALWSFRENAEDFQQACEKGKALGVLLNAQSTVYNDDDIFDYEEDDDEDGI